MRKIPILWLTLISLICRAEAASIALVYENEAALRSGPVTIGTVISDGVLIPAQLAFSGGNNLLIGSMEGGLYRGSLVRLDNDLNLAIVRLGGVVSDSSLQRIHGDKVLAVSGFLPSLNISCPTVSGTELPFTRQASLTIKDPNALFQIKIDGKEIGSEIFDLKSSLRKSYFDLELVYISTVPVWNFSIQIISQPTLSFWKKNKKTSLTEVPRPNFNYDHQEVFTPLREGKSVVIPMEAHFMDEGKIYEWTFRVSTKNKKQKFSSEQKAQVKFH